jgi:hypothetical protein
MSDIFNGENNECALDVDRAFCSNAETINKVAEYVKQKSGDSEISESPLVILKHAKKITKCETEECALKTIASHTPSASAIIKKNIKENIKLDGPADSQQLLNNNNIDSILHQLVGKHKSLKHIEFHMINFDEKHKELDRINMLTDVIDKNLNTMCVVINTDVYNNGGIHWFCLFCDFRTGGTKTNPFTIEYFNSSGNRPMPSVSKWITRTLYEIESTGIYNVRAFITPKIRHQIDTETECGVYCLYYIHKRLNNIPIEHFDERIPDAEMIKFRNKLFRNRVTNPAK